LYKHNVWLTQAVAAVIFWRQFASYDFHRFYWPVEGATEGGVCLSWQLSTAGTELRTSPKAGDEAGECW